VIKNEKLFIKYFIVMCVFFFLEYACSMKYLSTFNIHFYPSRYRIESEMNVLYKIIICFCLIPLIKHSSAQLNDDPDLLQFLKIQENHETCQKNSTLIMSEDSFGENYCPKQFDGILCWNQTIKNKWSEQPCPS